MAKTKDFYGKDISDVIEQACRAFATTQDALRIEVLETGSTGIFGLCKKKAHIRARPKADAPDEEEQRPTRRKSEERPERTGNRAQARKAKDKAPAPASLAPEEALDAPQVEKPGAHKGADDEKPASEPLGTAALPVESAPMPEETSEALVKGPAKEGSAPPPERRARSGASADCLNGDEAEDAEEEPGENDEEEEPTRAPSSEDLNTIRETVSRLLELMRMPAEVVVNFERHTIHCAIRGEHEQALIGPDGRILDSLQYLLRKMLAAHLPERVVLLLNVGDFRERRMEDLKTRALDFADQAKRDGKTRVFSALNPAERRLVHIALQNDKEIRSRSVGEGLFKKVLIYKPGVKGSKRRSSPRKRRKSGSGGANDHGTGD